jgi:hypothetical protein
MIRRIFLALPLLLLPALVLAQDLSGTYRAEGRNPDGSAYTGSVRIDEEGSAIRVYWTIGASSYDGLGFRDGRVLVVDWGEQDPVVYVVMADGELHGTWADGTALERLIPN